jgi:hypothetical protein
MKERKKRIQLMKELNRNVKQKYPPTEKDAERHPTMHRTDRSTVSWWSGEGGSSTRARFGVVVWGGVLSQGSRMRGNPGLCHATPSG